MPDPSHDQLIAASGLPRSEARLLLAHVMGCDKTWLIAHGDETPSAEVAARALGLFARRVAGEPVAYLLGEREFYGRRFAVSPAVLIPRPETEGLIDWALSLLPTLPMQARALDLGCGSGCIGLSLALEAAREHRPLGHLALVDLSASALAQARANAQALQVAKILPAQGLSWHEGSWFAPLDATQRFDLVLSNPPYIAPGDPHLAQGDLRHEPRGALESADRGLGDLQQIIAAAPNYLQPGAWLLLEHGYDQSAAVAQLLAQAGFQALEAREDLAGLPRLSGARWPG